MRSRSWPGFRSVLCPVDFSEHSRLALRYAEAVARRGGATLTVTYANDPLLIAAAAAASLHDRHLARRSSNELRTFIDATLSASSRKRLHVRSEVSIGLPADEILRVAARRRSDLIVVGTQGLTGAQRLFIGSTTLSLLQRTTTPVLAIPRAGETEWRGVSASWPGDRIIAALDLDADPRREVDIGVRIAQWFGCSLLLLHVVDNIAAPKWIKGDLSVHERIHIARAQQQIDTLAAGARRQVTTETRVTCGRVSDEIAALAATEGIGLVVTALRDRHSWFGARRGSVSYHLLSHAVTPVLACPPRWRPR